MKSPHISRRIKFFTAIFLPVFILYLSILMGTAYQQRSNFRSKIELIESNINTKGQNNFETEITNYLSNGVIITDIVEKIFSTSVDSQKINDQLYQFFSTYMINHKIYDQIRFIDKSGKERIRVNWSEKKGITITPPFDLQFKGERPYFKKAILHERSIYTSTFDLNMEFGKIEYPIKPVIRIAFPVKDQQKNIMGILVLNLLGKNLINLLNQAGTNSNGDIYLVNEKGFWLKGPSSDHEWLFMLKDSVTSSAKADFPDEWKKISSADIGKFYSSKGLFLFSTIDLKKSHKKYYQNFDNINIGEKWKIISFINNKKLTPPWWEKIIFTIYSGAIVLGILAWYFTSLRIKKNQAREQLSQNEKKLKIITDSVQDAVVMIDSSGNVEFWNSCAEDIFGFTGEEVMGKNIHEFITPETLRKDAEEGLKKFSSSGQGSFIGELREVEPVRKNGTKFPAELNLNAIFFEGQWWAVGVVRDITQRKENEKQTIENAAKFQAIFNQTFQFIGLLSIDGTLLEANDTALKFAGISADEIKGIKFWETPWWSSSTKENEKVKNAVLSAAKGEFIRYEADVTGKDKIQATIDFSIKPVFDNQNNVVFLIPEGRDISDKKKFEQALKTSEIQLKTFVKYTPAAVAMFDNEIRYIIASDRWYSDYGIEGQNIIGKSHYDVFPEIEDMNEWKDIHQRCLKGETIKKEEDSFPRSDGKTDWLRWEVRPWFDSNEKIGGIIMFTEVITKRKEAETTLFRQAQILDQIVEAVITTDLEGNITRWNKAAESLFGYTPDEIINEFIIKLFSPEEHKYFRTKLTADIIKNGFEQIEAKMQKKNNEEFFAYLSLSIERDKKNKVTGFIVSGLDITLRKKTEHALKISEDRFRKAIEDAPYPAMIHADDGEILSINRPWTSISGYNKLHIPTINDWAFRAFGDNANKNLMEIKKLYEIEETVNQGEFTILTANARLIEWEISTSPLGFLPDGRKAMITMAVDITERKMAESQILALNMDLEKRVENRTRKLEQLVHKITRKERMMKLLGDVASTANTADSAKKAMETTLSLIGIFTGWPLGHIYIPSPDDETLLISSSIWFVDGQNKSFNDFIKITEKRTFKIDEGLPGRIYKKKRPLWIEDVTKDDSFIRTNNLSHKVVRGAFGFPVITKNKVVAVLEFFSPKAEKQNTSVLEMAGEVGNQLGYVIERKKIEKAMTESERKFRGIFEQSFQLVGLLSTEGKILQVNETALKMTDIPEEEINGKFLWDGPWWQHSKKHAQEIKDAVIEAASGKFIRIETTHKDKAGKIHYIDFSIKPIQDESGNTLYLIPEGRDITDRKEAEAEARKLALVVEKTSTGIIIANKEGQIEWFNKGFEKISGYKLNELIGISPGKVLQGPKTDQKTVKEIAKALKEKKQINVEIINYKKNGEKYWVEIDIQPIIDDNGEVLKFIAVETDITERKETEEALKQFKTALDQTHDAVFMFNPETLLFIYVNQGAATQLGYTMEELIKISPVDIKPEFTEETFREITVSLINGDNKSISFETFHQHKNGNLIPVDILLQYVDTPGEPPRFVAIVRDITEQKKINKELEKARDAAQQAAIAKGEFLANMSHEIRTPMNAIIGMTYLVLQTQLNNRQRDYLFKIETSAKSLLGIINDILDFSKIEAGKLKIEQTPFELSDVLDDTITLSAPRISKKELELIVNIDKKVPPIVIGDPVRVGQVFNNLISNAVKFTDKGEIEIIVRLIEKYIQTVLIEVVIADTGIGMTENQTSKLFQKFSQADTATTRNYGGTGLGLAICKQLVHLMGGDIRVESIPGQGSQFIFTMTLGYKEDKNVKFSHHVLPLNLRNLNVLLIDSNIKNLTNIEEQLKSLTFRVKSFTDVNEGSKALKDSILNKTPFELIIIDYRNCIKNDSANENEIWKELKDLGVPVVQMVTIKDLVESEKNIQSLEMGCILNKPVTPSGLFNSIVDAFGYKENKDKGEKGVIKRSSDLDKIKGAKILLVEDNAMNQQVAVELLNQVNIDVKIANNGLEACKIIENEKFDLVLMDIQMPRMDGIEAAKKIRSFKHIPQSLPIIAMTAHAMTGDSKKSLDAGMNDHISKPVDPQKLYDSLIKWIPLRKREKSNFNDLKSGDTSTSEFDIDMQNRLPDINIRAGLERVGNNNKLYKNLLKEFAGDYNGLGDEIESDISENRMESLLRTIHTIKGLSATIGAMNLHESTIELEEAINKESPSLTKLVKTFKIELNKIISQISELFPQENNKEKISSSPPLNEKEKKEVIKQLKELKKKIGNNDMSSEDFFNSLKPKIEPFVFNQSKEITSLLETLNFKKASLVVDEVTDFLEKN